MIWGDFSNRRNIDKVLGAGFPCIIEADWQLATPFQKKKYGATHRVAQHARLEILPDQ